MQMHSRHSLRRTGHTRIIKYSLLVLSLMGAGALSASRVEAAPAKKALGNRTIVYSARYYLKPGSSGTSYYHLYAIRPDGSGKRALTSGKHDDTSPYFSPDGRRIAFIRDDHWLCIVQSDGTKLRNIYSINDWGIYNPRWSPNGKTIAFVASDGITFVDVATGKLSRLNDANYFEWSPDGRRLAIEKEKSSVVTLLELATHHETKLSKGTVRPAWLSNTEVVTVLSHEEEDFPKFDKFAIFGTDGKQHRQLSILAHNTDSGDGSDYIDPRSRLRNIPGTSGAFVFVWDESTSSGQNARYFRIDAKTGAARPLADGQSFDFAPNGKSFVFAPYYNLTPYDTLPNGHKRVVYTSPLIVSNGKTQHTIVSGMVVMGGCGWR